MEQRSRSPGCGARKQRASPASQSQDRGDDFVQLQPGRLHARSPAAYRQAPTSGLLACLPALLTRWTQSPSKYFHARRGGRCLIKNHAGGVCMTGAPNSQQNRPSLKAEVSASSKTSNRVRTQSAMEAKVSCRGRLVNGRQRTGRRPTLHSTSHPVLNGVAQALLLPLRFPPISWVAAAKVGLDDEAQLKLRGLGEGHAQKRTRTILLSCQMTLPCSMLTLAIGAVPPRCRSFVPHATSCRTTS